MRRIIFLGALLFSLGLQAQNIEFKEKKHDFGPIEEKGGKVTYVFKFKNSGEKPLILNGVTASCGCTTPEWTKEPVMPGKSGTIKAVFNPLNRSGQFNKSITVNSNAENGKQVLYIRGTIKKQPPKLEDYYRHRLGDLSFRSTYAAFTKIKDSEVQTRELEFVNMSGKEVKLAPKDQPPFIQIKFIPETVKPKEKGKAIVTFDGTKANMYGYNMHYVYMTQNGVADSKNRIMVSSNLKEDFSKWTGKQLKKAPHAQFESAKVQDLKGNGKRVSVNFDFGTIEAGKKVEHVFKFKNTGDSDLIIRRTKASCGCTAIAPSKKVIAPGEEGEIKAIFDSKGRSGPQSKQITVTLNDPEAPTVNLYLMGRIE